MTKHLIEELVKFVYDDAKELVESDKQVLPKVFLLKEDGTYAVVICPDSMESENNKDSFVEAIKKIVHKEKAVVLVFISESWTIGQDRINEFMSNRHLYPSLSTFPGKVSCVMITIEEKGCAGKMGTAIIDESVNPKKLGPLNFFKHDRKEGRFSNLLDTEVSN